MVARSVFRAEEEHGPDDERWEVLEPLIPDHFRRVDGRGRPWRDSRDVLNGILCVLRTGAPWHDLAPFVFTLSEEQLNPSDDTSASSPSATS